MRHPVSYTKKSDEKKNKLTHLVKKMSQFRQLDKP